MGLFVAGVSEASSRIRFVVSICVQLEASIHVFRFRLNAGIEKALNRFPMGRALSLKMRMGDGGVRSGD